jgi:hypothetical protein
MLVLEYLLYLSLADLLLLSCLLPFKGSCSRTLLSILRALIPLELPLIIDVRVKLGTLKSLSLVRYNI